MMTVVNGGVRIIRGIHTRLTRYLPENTLLLIYAALIGVGGGYGAVGFRTLIDLVVRVGYGLNQLQLASYHGPRAFLVPAAGGLVVGLIVFLFAREAKGHGVPEVMYAVTEAHGIIRPRVVVAKALASAVCIGSGGSVGREGPIVQIGSAWGSAIGQLIGIKEDQLKTLVACGAAAGIAATFNAPIGGVLFASEIILGSFAISNLGYIVVSSVLSAAIGRIYFGTAASFAAPPYSVNGVLVLSAFVVLGLVGGLWGVFYSRALYFFEDLWDRLKALPEWARPALGGLLVGAIGFFFPQVFGVGYPTIEQALNGSLGFALLAALLFLKLLATCTTIASGGSGGVFAPGLFMGAMLGGAYGDLLRLILPGLPVTNGAFAVVGMATVFASSARAPITAMVMLFELTGNYQLILPLMLSTVIATILASLLERESIYTLKLARRGVDIVRRRSADRLTALLVSEAMRPLEVTLHETQRIREAASLLAASPARAGRLLRADGSVRGVISYAQLLEELKRERRSNARLKTLQPMKTGCVLASSPLSEAGRLMGELAAPFLVVLDEEGDPAGIIDSEAILQAYGKK